jgi:Raf kinase inhibitor-like YbhB/YbcL family protein
VAKTLRSPSALELPPYLVTRAAGYLAIASGISSAQAVAMSLTSMDIKPNSAIPTAQIYPRCGGANISPELAWTGVPGGTKSLALTMIDLDVKPSQWSHWIVVGLPPDTTSLPRGVQHLPGGAHAVISNFGDAAYDGPCPPAGSGVHRYQITIWALPAAAPPIAADANAADLTAILARQALSHASLTGFVQR